jgi:hypothetical protein
VRSVTAQFGARVGQLLAGAPARELEVFLEGVELVI